MITYLSNPKHCLIALSLLGFSQSLHAEYPEFIAYAEDGIFTELEHGLILTTEQRSRLEEFKLQRSKQSRYFAAYAQSREDNGEERVAITHYLRPKLKP